MGLFTVVNSPTVFINTSSWFKDRFLTNYGYIEEVPTSNDLNFESSPIASNPLPIGDISLKHYFKEISDQSSLSCCVANAVADALEAQIAHTKGISPSMVNDLSRLFIYFNARNLNTPPSIDVDNGSKIRLVFDSAARYGVCDESIWTYDLSKVNVRPSILAYRRAIENRIYKFYRIFATEDDKIKQIKQALVAGCPVVFGIKISESFKYICNDTVFTSPTSGWIGSHAMVIVGWSESKQAFLVRNSWGTSWGMNGYAYLSKNYIKYLAKDVWAATF